MLAVANSLRLNAVFRVKVISHSDYRVKSGWYADTTIDCKGFIRSIKFFILCADKCTRFACCLVNACAFWELSQKCVALKMRRNEGPVDLDSIADEIKVALPKLRRFARALAGSNDWEDLVQATLERALTRSHLYEAGTRIDSWLFRIAQNLHINDVKSARRREDATDSETLAKFGPTTEGNAEAYLLLSRVSEAIDDLPVDQRIALTAIALDGQSFAEATARLGLEPGTIASRVGRARTTLRRVIENDDP